MKSLMSVNETIAAQENLVIDFQFAIQEKLVKAKISRAELARRCGLSVRKISNLMRAEGNPTVREVALIFAALNQVVKIRPYSVRRPRHEPGE